ncbi:hypothetical protein CF326_g2819 [Tilletia indica]|nr:hypothetical protein CF326_g2819 [Tilletia indica]
MTTPTLRTSAYQTYKDDTLKVSTWLAQAAVEHGYPITAFQVSAHPSLSSAVDRTDMTSSQLKNAKKKAKQKAAKNNALRETENTESTPPSQPTVYSGSYSIMVDQYIELATFIIEKQVEIPIELLQVLRRCIRLRHAAQRRFEFTHNAEVSESNEGHSYFIDVLRRVGETLQNARAKLMRQEVSKNRETQGEEVRSSQISPESPEQTNRFASLADMQQDLEDITLEDDEQVQEVIHIPQPSRPGNSSIYADKTVFDAKMRIGEAIMAATAFIDDLADIKEYITQAWEDYADGRIDPVSAALVTNTALELLRRPLDEFTQQVLPAFDDSLKNMISTMFTFFIKTLRDPSILKALDPEGEDPDKWDEVKKRSLTMYLGSRAFAPTYKALEGVMLAYPELQPRMYLNDDDLDLGDLSSYHVMFSPFGQTIELHRKIVWAAYLDYGLLRYHRETRAHIYLLPKYWIEDDEIGRAMEEVHRTRKITLHSLFCIDVLVHINLTLQEKTERGLDDLRVGSRFILDSIEKQEELKPRTYRPAGWGPWNDRGLMNVQNLARQRSFSVDVLSLLPIPEQQTGKKKKKKNKAATATSETKSDAPQPKEKIPERTLMKRNPVLCGISLFRLRCLAQDLGLRLANAWQFTLLSGHLYYACKNWGLKQDPDEFAPWEDMDHVLKMFGAEKVMGGKIPESLQDSWIGYLKMTGGSIHTLREIRKQDTFQAIDSKGHRPLPENPEDEFVFQDWTKVVKNLKIKYQGSKTVTPVNVDFIHSLLCDLAAEEDKKSSDLQLTGKKDGEESLGHALVRRRRTGKASKKKDISILRLLNVLENHLETELDIITFDHIGLHSRAARMLQTVADGVRHELELGGLERMIKKEFPSVVEFALRLGSSAERKALASLRSGGVYEPSSGRDFFQQAAKEVDKFLRDTDEGDMELCKMNVWIPEDDDDSDDDWDDEGSDYEDDGDFDEEELQNDAAEKGEGEDEDSVN